VALTIIWTGLAWLRLGPVTSDTIWAEDGHYFLGDALRYGPVPALFVPYEGYMHLLPRTIAGIASLLPASLWAQALSLLSCLAAGLVALLVYIVSAQLPIAAWARLLLASVTVLVPTIVAEVLGNAANMYTFALWAALWLFLFRPARWWSAVIAGVIALLVSGTAIQMIALVPLFAIGWTRRKLPVVIGFVVGLGIQLWGFTHSVRHSKPSWPPLGTINDGYLHQVGLGSWIESAHYGAAIILRLGWIAACLALVPFAIAVVVLWRARVETRRARLLAVALPAASYVYWFAFFALNNLATDYANSSPAALVAGSATIRYAVFPSMILWALIILAIGWNREPGSTPRWWGRTRVIAAGVLLLCMAVNFVPQTTPFRAIGPDWTDKLREAQAVCRSEAASDSVAIPTAPFGAWSVSVPCRIVEKG
jgi:hypothetical protein